MTTENGWGAPPIHAELLKLGLLVSDRTVSRYMPKEPTPREALERWKAFLRNHREVLAAMDFFTVPTVKFCVLYVFFVIGHGRRRILHANVTAHPTAEWIVQQLREAFAFGTAPRYVILDRDRKYGSVVPEKLLSWGVKLVRIAWLSPWQNGTAERWVLSVRKELLARVVVLNEAHLRQLLAEYVAWYNGDRCHLAPEKDAQDRRQRQRRPGPAAQVVALLRVGGIHHRYEWSDSLRIAA